MIRALACLSLVAIALPVQARAQDSQCRSLRARGNFRLNGASQYIDQAEHTTYADQKATRLNNALRVLNEAAQQGGGDQFSMWYLFAKVYGMQGDLRGADSALTKAAGLIPSDSTCLTELTRQRRNMWIPLQNDAVGQIQEQHYDSAIALLRKASLIYRDDPSGYLNMASAYLAKQQEDSAAMMFRMASRAGTSADRADLRATAAFNAARIMQRQNHLPAAESLYRDYLRMKPNDVEAKGSLAAMLTQMGRPQDAAAIYDSLMANADSLDSFGLFQVGVALFRQGQLDSLPANAARRRQAYASAARAFELGLAKNPGFRDALFNLTNTYLAASDTQKVLDAAQRLVRADSLNRTSFTLLARALQMNRRTNEVVAALAHRDSIPVEVSVLRFDPRDSTASIRGGVQNLTSREKAAFNLILEFTNARGEVVATERVEVPTLNASGQPGSLYDFNVQANGRGIVGYRYKIG